ncbi:MAG: S-adenosylmethionine:tRNA ribosyltransferase-isomerase [Myxococcota bacterium]
MQAAVLHAAPILPATGPSPDRPRLLWFDAARDRRGAGDASALLQLLEPGDVLVLNDAATLPGALFAHTVPEHAPLELRLIARQAPSEWTAAIFGAGDWRTPTERREAPPPLGIGDRLALEGSEIEAEILGFLDTPRLLRLRFLASEEALAHALYARGRPVQYSYLSRDLRLDEVQTAYATRPIAVEMPSAGRPLTWRLLLELRRRGVEIVSLTHAAGLSSIGDEALDKMLPLPEHYEIPAATVAAIEGARRRRSRVIAVGTTVVRALESAAQGSLRAGAGVASLVIGPEHRLAIVDGILSGTHESGSSHYRLLRAFLPEDVLQSLLVEASARAHRGHEFGDTMLILRPPR